MALPSSGVLSLNDIHVELVNGGLVGPTYPWSLRSMSDVAGKSFATGESRVSSFYGYAVPVVNWNYIINNNTGFCTGQMDIYIDSALEVSTTINGDSGTVYSPAGSLVEIYVSTYTFVFGMAVAEIYYGPVLYVSNTSPGGITSYYSFTHPGGAVSITGLSYDY